MRNRQISLLWPNTFTPIDVLVLNRIKYCTGYDDT